MAKPAKVVKKEIKTVLHHAFEEMGGISKEDWIASYDKFLAEFQKSDKDGDGLVDRSEWKDEYGGDEAFDAYDLNGDGTMDQAEFAHARETEGTLRELDADGDGKISREEWIAMYGNAVGYDEYDLDGDGIIDANEFRKAKSAEFEFGRLDKDGDGVVSLEEWIAKYGSADGFYEMDLDGDGMIDAAEFRQVKTKQMAERKFQADEDRDLGIRHDAWVERYGNDKAFVPSRAAAAQNSVPQSAVAGASSRSWRHEPVPCNARQAPCSAAEQLRQLQMANIQLQHHFVDPGHVLRDNFPGRSRAYGSVAYDRNIDSRFHSLNRIYADDGKMHRSAGMQMYTRGFVRPFKEVLATKGPEVREMFHPLL